MRVLLDDDDDKPTDPRTYVSMYTGGIQKGLTTTTSNTGGGMFRMLLSWAMDQSSAYWGAREYDPSSSDQPGKRLTLDLQIKYVNLYTFSPDYDLPWPQYSTQLDYFLLLPPPALLLLFA